MPSLPGYAGLCILLSLLLTPALASYAIITGASSGIGRALSLEAANKDYSVVLAARRGDELQALKKEIEETHGNLDVVTVACDLGTSEGIDKLRRATAELDDVQVLFANAGFAWSGSLVEQDVSNIEDMVALNVLAVTKLSRLYGADFAARGSGAIMLTSSLTAVAALPGASQYAATRGFVRQFAAGLRSELAPRGVRVTTLLPGATDTEFAEKTNIQQALIFNFPGSRQLGLTLSSEVVARYALSGLLKGPSEVIPGFVNRLYFMAADNIMPSFISSGYAASTFCQPNPLLNTWETAIHATIVMLLGTLCMVPCIPFVCLSFITALHYTSTIYFFFQSALTLALAFGIKFYFWK
jgi:short-subunit dehydrogenase